MSNDGLLQALMALASFVSSGVGAFLLFSIEKYLERLNENTIAIAVLAVEVKSLQREFEILRESR